MARWESVDAPQDPTLIQDNSGLAVMLEVDGGDPSGRDWLNRLHKATVSEGLESLNPEERRAVLVSSGAGILATSSSQEESH